MHLSLGIIPHVTTKEKNVASIAMTSSDIHTIGSHLSAVLIFVCVWGGEGGGGHVMYLVILNYNSSFMHRHGKHPNSLSLVRYYFYFPFWRLHNSHSSPPHCGKFFSPEVIL